VWRSWGPRRFTGPSPRALGDRNRARKLLEHIRYRTGLLLERRPGIFAFAHLTFQEYLAARAVHEGNLLGIGVEELARDHADARWNEVIALYCALAPAPSARDLIERLIAEPDTERLAGVLTEAYLATRPEVVRDPNLRQRVLERVARAPSWVGINLSRFPAEEVSPLANRLVGTVGSLESLSEAYSWLVEHPDAVDIPLLRERLLGWRTMSPSQVTELLYLLHLCGDDALLNDLAKEPELYAAPGPGATPDIPWSQAEGVLIALGNRSRFSGSGFAAVLVTVLCVLSERPPETLIKSMALVLLCAFWPLRAAYPNDPSDEWPPSVVVKPEDLPRWLEVAVHLRGLSMRLKRYKSRKDSAGGVDEPPGIRIDPTEALEECAKYIEANFAGGEDRSTRGRTSRRKPKPEAGNSEP
jgi:hypothetical protein